MAAVMLLPGVGSSGGLEYNQVMPALMEKYLPQGVLGVAVTGLLAAFMAGMAANVSSFNAVFTYDIWQDYLKPGRSDRHYLIVGRVVTVGGVLLAIATSLIASSFSNIQNYLQTLSSFFNVPLFCVFIIGMFWRRASRNAGFWGILTGTLTAAAVYALYQLDVLNFRSDLQETMWGSIAAFAAGAATMIAASLLEKPKTAEELHGLVYGMAVKDVSETSTVAWYHSPIVLGIGALGLCAALYVSLYVM
ncbi:MAG: Na+/galactose cotransporter, partial [Mycobacterium sp.]|nr:Na+/galactose cotransporter [Mycobacterium sp.]